MAASRLRALLTLHLAAVPLGSALTLIAALIVSVAWNVLRGALISSTGTMAAALKPYL